MELRERVADAATERQFRHVQDVYNRGLAYLVTGSEAAVVVRDGVTVTGSEVGSIEFHAPYPGTQAILTVHGRFNLASVTSGGALGLDFLFQKADETYETAGEATRATWPSFSTATYKAPLFCRRVFDVAGGKGRIKILNYFSAAAGTVTADFAWDLELRPRLAELSTQE